MAKATDISRFLPPKVRRLRKLVKSGAAPSDRRKRKRITLAEINKFGAEALSKEDREELTKAPDKRTAFTKFLDLVDIPRNLVANAAAGIAGVKPKQQRPGAILPKVWASDLLEAMGMKKGVGRAVLGFTADVALDPLTYLGTGARTGLRFLSGTPKVLPKGVQAVKGAADTLGKGVIKGISDDVVRGLGKSPLELRKLSSLTRQRVAREAARKGVTLTEAQIAKRASKVLHGRRGGELTRTLGGRAIGEQGLKGAKESRKFFTKFGAKGRTIARVPFTQASITAKTGREARLFREFAKVTPDIAGQVAQRGIINKAIPAAVSATARGAARATEGAEALAGGQMVAQTGAKIKASLKLRDARKGLRALTPKIGFRATKPQLKELRRLERVINTGGAVPKTDIARRAAAGASRESRQAIAGYERILRDTEAARRAGRVIPLAQVRAESAAKQALDRIIKGETATFKRGLADSAKRTTAELGRLKGVTTEARTKLSEIAFSPTASESVKAQTIATHGKPYYTHAQARLIHGQVAAEGGVRQESLGRRFITEAGRIKNRLFGPGQSQLGQAAAGADAARRTGSHVARELARADWAKNLEPIVQQFVARTGQPVGDVHKILFDIIEAGAEGARFVPEDPILKIVAGAQPLLDDTARNTLAQYGRQHAKILKELDDAGVSPGSVVDYLARRPTEDFLKVAAPEIKRAIADTGFNPARVKELRWTDDAGQIHSAFTSPTTKDQARVAELTKQFGKPERFDISTRRFNTDPKIANSLQPDVANARMEMFKQTLPDAAGEMARQRTNRLALADMSNWARQSGIPSEALSNQATRGRYPGFAQVQWDKASPAYQTVLKGLEGQAFPQQIVDMLERFMEISKQPAEINKILGWSDKSLNLWKGVTLAHPAYTIRNVFQNLVGNVMAGQKMGPYLSQARPGSRVHQITTATMGQQQAQGTIRWAGVEHSAQEFSDILRQNNIIMSGMIGEALPNVAQAPGKFLRKLKPLQRWFAFNSEIESTMKAASLWGFLDQGMDLQTALKKVAQAMPDLADLTLFERNVARRLIPFYSWFRKNGALQLFHYLPKAPQFIAAPAKIKQAMEGALRGDNVVPESLRPAWMQAMQGIQVSGDEEKGSVFLAASWLPFQELIKFGSGAFDIGEGARAIAETGRPSLRLIAEQASGQDIFRQTPLPQTSPAGALRQLPQALIGRGPLGGVLGVRPLREAFRVGEVAEQQGPVAGAGRVVLGGAFQPINRQRGLSAETQRLRALSIELRQKVNRALQVGDQALADQLQRQLLQTMIQMHQMGLPGVPQATQRTFQQAGVQAGAPAFGGR